MHSSLSLHTWFVQQYEQILEDMVDEGAGSKKGGPGSRKDCFCFEWGQKFQCGMRIGRVLPNSQGHAQQRGPESTYCSES